MRICVETSAFHAKFSGIGQYTWFFLRGLCKTEKDLRLIGFDGAAFQPINSASLEKAWRKNEEEAKQVSVQPSHLNSLLKRVPYARKTYYFARKMDRVRRFRDFDLLHAVNYLVPAEYRGRTLPVVHDLSHERFPDAHPAERVERLRRGLASIDRYPLIQTISQFSADEIVDFYQIDPKAVRVVYPGVNPRYTATGEPADAAILARFGLQRLRFFLAVGTLEPRKNLDTVLNAFRLLPKAVRIEYPLVLVGQPGWGNAGTSDVHSLLDEGSLRILGYQPENSLAALYRHSRTVLFPSIYEGFGIPTVEALASGKRPILSDIPVMREVAAQAADFIEPRNVDDWKTALQAVVEDRGYDEGRYQAASIARSQIFDWAETSRQTADLYHEAKLAYDAR